MIAKTTPCAYDAPTFPPMIEREAREGMVWAERLLSQVRACASDGTRFVAGLP